MLHIAVRQPQKARPKQLICGVVQCSTVVQLRDCSDKGKGCLTNVKHQKCSKDRVKQQLKHFFVCRCAFF